MKWLTQNALHAARHVAQLVVPRLAVAAIGGLATLLVDVGLLDLALAEQLRLALSALSW